MNLISKIHNSGFPHPIKQEVGLRPLREAFAKTKDNAEEVPLSFSSLRLLSALHGASKGHVQETLMLEYDASALVRAR